MKPMPIKNGTTVQVTPWLVCTNCWESFAAFLKRYADSAPHLIIPEKCPKCGITMWYARSTPETRERTKQTMEGLHA